MKAQEMWNLYQKINENALEYEAWSYGCAADELLELTLQGKKTATASAYEIYGLESEKVPETGDFSVILDSKGEAGCIIQTTKVTVKKFSEVGDRQAYLEGEGDRSLAYWREVHEEFFRQDLAQHGLEFTEDMLVVCEEFEIVYPK